MRTKVAGSRTGMDCSAAMLYRLNARVQTPMPSARTTIAVTENPGDLARMRTPNRRSCTDGHKPERSAAFAAVFLDLLETSEFKAGCPARFGFS